MTRCDACGVEVAPQRFENFPTGEFWRWGAVGRMRRPERMSCLADPQRGYHRVRGSAIAKGRR